MPFVTHVDHTEHDVDIVVTEQGYADLRGLPPLLLQVGDAEVLLDDRVRLA